MTYEGEKIEFFVCKKKIKNVNIKINRNGIIVISAPYQTTIKRIKEIILEKINWIKKSCEYVKSLETKKEKLRFEEGESLYILGEKYILKIVPSDINQVELSNKFLTIYVKEQFIDNKEYIEKIYIKWIKEVAVDTFNKGVRKYCKKVEDYNISVPDIEVKQMKSRWGTCMIGRKRIIFNLGLIRAPIECVEYIALHEIAHFKHPGHDKKFYDFVQNFMPDWKQRKKLLDEKY